MDQTFRLLMTQLLIQSPMLLVCFAGGIVALVFWRRFPRPCLLTFIAMSLEIVITIVISCLQAYLLPARSEFHWTAEQYGFTMALVGILANVVRAVAFGILLGAVISSRTPSRPLGGPAL